MLPEWPNRASMQMEKKTATRNGFSVSRENRAMGE